MKRCARRASSRAASNVYVEHQKILNYLSADTGKEYAEQKCTGYQHERSRVEVGEALSHRFVMSVC